MDIGRRQFLKASIAGLALLTLPRISFAQSNPDVIVIGAGSAGLSATAELMKKGKSVVCIEAMNRIGGRCYTDNSIFGVPYDMGAHWLHGYTHNQIAKYGKKHKDIFNIYKDQDESYLVYDGRKRLVWPQDKPLWDLYDEIKGIKNSTAVDVPFINLIPKEIQNNEWFDTVQKIITTRDFDNFSAYDDNVNWRDPGSSDGFCSQGYGTLLAHYRKDVPVKLNTAAKEIKWDGKGVKVYTSQGTISAKACIITVSTGVLNAGKIKFTPTLPVKKYEAFDGISMSSYYRVTLQLKEKFYKNFNIGPETYFYTKVNSNKSKSPRSANGVLRDLKNNISFFNIKGQFARELEAQGIKASVDFVLSDLRSTFGSNFDQYLIKSHVTDWLSNPFTLGAYSGAKPGKARLRKVLKESVGDRIFFAGEATAGAHGTVHGADRSGKRVVEELLRS
jgi:monoamine oxidase